MAMHSHRDARVPILAELRLTQQIVAFWVVFLLGLLFHTQIALMPLFHGLGVLAPHGHVATSITEITPVLWGMVAFFVLPLVAILALVVHPSRRLCQAHFGLTVVYTLLNIGHLAADLLIKPVAWYQIVLMVLLLVVGLLLNRFAYQWWRMYSPHPRPLSAT